MNRHYLYIICAALLTFIASCTNDDIEGALTAEKRELIGTAVNFDASVADAFNTRTSYSVDGRFNEDDIMTIYRQYFGTTDFDSLNEVFRVYRYRTKYATGNSGISLGKDWIVAGERSGFLSRKKGDYSPAGVGSRTLTTAQQTDADSLTWENGKTLRFRAWSRSNLAGALSNGSKNLYYPDFEASDWVNVSGPTNVIPLTLKHIGSRIFFMYKNSGTRLQRVEISTDPADYAREDNAASNTQDAADKFPKTVTVNGVDMELTPQQAADAVAAVYKRMCMPAGIDLENGTLNSMTKAAYDITTDFRHIEEWEYTPEGRAKLVAYRTRTPQQIADEVQRPVFTTPLDSRCYLITIPYDMSNADTHGDILTLPSWTRFRVWLYDVNGGDEAQKGSEESNYHIFALDDIRNGDEPLYKNGLQLRPGYSYEFKVGYRYKQLTITAGENPSWVDQDAVIMSEAESDVVTRPSANKYEWWKNAIADAIPRGQENYQPEFHITSEEQFLEFISLVNGTAGAYGANPDHKIYRLVKEYTTITNKDGTISKEPKEYGWSRINNQQNPEWVDRVTLEDEGYVFYEHYHPADGDNKAYSEEDYLQGAYPFYDSNLGRHFTVYLDADLDFKDMKMDAVGTSTNLFKGYFDAAPAKTVHLNDDGTFAFTDDANDPRILYDSVTVTNVHTIRNLNVNGGYLFGYVQDAAIRNLMIESYHTIGLLNTATPSMDGSKEVGWGCYILGISVKANNTITTEHNAIAHSLTGRSIVVGCIHEGDAAGALVGSAANMTMFGCMRTASNIGEGALMGRYPAGSSDYLKAQVSLSVQRSSKNFSTKPSWGRFMCNFYNKDIREDSREATAVGGYIDDYSLLEYIRGRKSRILRAQNDNLLSKEVPLASLNPQQQEEYYGIAPWKAMNYAIYKYNTDPNYYGKDHPCKVHYEVGTVGYDHTYPQLTSGAPEDYGSWNVLNQNN